MSEPQQEMDVLELLKKMQQQLIYLEKKIDTLIAQRPAQGQDRPFQKDRNFSRPFKPYGRPYSGGSSDRGGNREGRSDYRPDNRPSHRPDHRSDSRPGHFNKPRSEGGQSTYPKKKPFYAKRER